MVGMMDLTHKITLAAALGICFLSPTSLINVAAMNAFRCRQWSSSAAWASSSLISPPRTTPTRTAFTNSSSTPTPPNSLVSPASYYFIIVGGGTAGLALAARLTESGNQTVLVLEAGPAPTIVAAYKSAGADQLVLGSPIDWAFTTLPQQSLNGRQITYNRGRCLGGSSSINGLSYGRGSSSVYDLWESLGNPGWSWDDVFPLFVQSTHFNAPSDNVSYQGFDPAAYGNGPVQVGYPGYYYEAPGSTAFVECLGAIGVQPTDDLNAGNNVGAKQQALTIDTEYHRSSAYDNYYKQALGKPNLVVLTYSPAQQIILQQQGSSVLATGVVYSDYASGATVNVTATKEVILSAGSFQTPQLLLLSGIGSAATLAKNGIQMYVDNENVGMNLQDHAYFSINVRTQANVSASSLYNDIALLQTAEMQYQSSQGPLVASLSPSFGFQIVNVSTLEQLEATELLTDRKNQSHIEYYYEDFFYPSPSTPEYTPLPNESYVSLTAGVIAPVSRGSVSIKSSSISDPPQINLDVCDPLQLKSCTLLLTLILTHILQYYTAQSDQKLAIYAFKNLRTVLAQYASYGYTIGPDNGEVSPGPSVETDADILEYLPSVLHAQSITSTNGSRYIRNTAVTLWHASGTCAMLPQSQGGVVDARLRVYGVSGLRIVDTSIFPIIPDQHTQV